MAKQNRKQFSNTTANICPVCGKQHGYLLAKKAIFRANKSYNDGPCETCKPIFEHIIATLAAGGILWVCRCGAVSATASVPPEFEPLLTTMPNGVRRLDTQTCGQCAPKEQGYGKDTPQDHEGHPQTESQDPGATVEALGAA